jgi:hypothetical protein
MGINQCGDGLYYNPQGDFCDANTQLGTGTIPLGCPPDPECPTLTQSNTTTGSTEFVPSGTFARFSPCCRIWIESSRLLSNCPSSFYNGYTNR